MTRSQRLPLFTLLIGLLFASVAQSAPITLQGAGATFPFPLYSKWFSEYQRVNPEVQVNYQSIGSGGGIRQLIEKTVDFGASDAPMTDEQLSKAPSAVIHIPTVMGAVVITYQLSDLKRKLNLTPENLSDIFLGKIKKWNDASLKKNNPGMTLPDLDILVVHRSDGSGTTAIFTDYLTKVSPEWKEKVGAGTAVNWPTGLGAKGNEGVSGQVKSSNGAIGYVELVYAERNAMSYAALKNKSGKFIMPTISSVSAAAKGVKIPEDFRVSLTDASGIDAYPISGFTYLLVYKTMPKAKHDAWVGFLKWSMLDGQKFAPELFYAPLPSALTKKVNAKIATLAPEVTK